MTTKIPGSSMVSPVKPNEMDVVCGRGATAVNHPGNVYFRKLVRERCQSYVFPTSSTMESTTTQVTNDNITDSDDNEQGAIAISARQKYDFQTAQDEIVQEIVEALEVTGGRFVLKKKRKALGTSKDGADPNYHYAVIDCKERRSKIKQALRDCVKHIEKQNQLNDESSPLSATNQQVRVVASCDDARKKKRRADRRLEDDDGTENDMNSTYQRDAKAARVGIESTHPRANAHKQQPSHDDSARNKLTRQHLIRMVQQHQQQQHQQNNNILNLLGNNENRNVGSTPTIVSQSSFAPSGTSFSSSLATSNIEQNASVKNDNGSVRQEEEISGPPITGNRCTDDSATSSRDYSPRQQDVPTDSVNSFQPILIALQTLEQQRQRLLQEEEEKKRGEQEKKKAEQESRAIINNSNSSSSIPNDGNHISALRLIAAALHQQRENQQHHQPNAAVVVADSSASTSSSIESNQQSNCSSVPCSNSSESSSTSRSASTATSSASQGCRNRPLQSGGSTLPNCNANNDALLSSLRKMLHGGNECNMGQANPPSSTVHFALLKLLEGQAPSSSITPPPSAGNNVYQPAVDQPQGDAGRQAAIERLLLMLLQQQQQPRVAMSPPPQAPPLSGTNQLLLLSLLQQQQNQQQQQVSNAPNSEAVMGAIQQLLSRPSPANVRQPTAFVADANNVAHQPVSDFVAPSSSFIAVTVENNNSGLATSAEKEHREANSNDNASAGTAAARGNDNMMQILAFAAQQLLQQQHNAGPRRRG